ncbi:MAG: hypothetical protein GYB68_10440 [Chloroflexi bacterium]|nr:hypothetical protein [Chloroflexota bacterium]
MTILLDWLTADRKIAMWSFIGDWTWDDLVKIDHEWSASVRDLPFTVYLVHDFREAGRPPEHLLTRLPQILNLPHITDLTNMSNVHTLIGTSGILRRAAEIYSRVYGRLNLVDTPEEALELVAQAQEIPVN